ncbi:hypothetical protein E1B22_12535 (plasmid) [Thermaerobacter sp. FW80]|nr:hypothetical protein E1B22_12535 [Thermaerobacter sp. FW80]
MPGKTARGQAIWEAGAGAGRWGNRRSWTLPWCACPAQPGVRVRYVASPDERAVQCRDPAGNQKHRGRPGMAVSQRLGPGHRPGGGGEASLMGMCAGYQMLGLRVRDPRGAEASIGEVRGLAYLPVGAELQPVKTTRRRSVHVAPGGSGFWDQCAGAELEGYEIHMGVTRW